MNIIITLIISIILFIWVVYKRFIKKLKVFDAPMSLPRGTFRAIIAICLLSFPFSYVIDNEVPPSLIISSIFIVFAFYFENRSDNKNVETIIEEINNPPKKKTKNELPLYLPRYTVRIILTLILIILIVYKYQYHPDLEFSSNTTLFDLLMIMVFFVIGLYFRKIKTKGLMTKISNALANSEIESEGSKGNKMELLNNSELQKLIKREEITSRLTFSLFSIITLIALGFSFYCFWSGFDLSFNFFGLYNFTLSGSALLLLNAYYGFRQ